jgi:hypothetical protein
MILEERIHSSARQVSGASHINLTALAVLTRVTDVSLRFNISAFPHTMAMAHKVLINGSATMPIPVDY